MGSCCIHKELSSALCDDQRDGMGVWWAWVGGSRGRGYMCVHIADLICCTIETNTNCKATISSKKIKNTAKVIQWEKRESFQQTALE